MQLLKTLVLNVNELKALLVVDIISSMYTCLELVIPQNAEKKNSKKLLF